MEKTITGKTPLKRMTRLSRSHCLQPWRSHWRCLLSARIKAASRRNPESKGSADSTADMVGEAGDVWQRLNLTEAQKTQMKQSPRELS